MLSEEGADLGGGLVYGGWPAASLRSGIAHEEGGQRSGRAGDAVRRISGEIKQLAEVDPELDAQRSGDLVNPFVQHREPTSSTRRGALASA